MKMRKSMSKSKKIMIHIFSSSSITKLSRRTSVCRWNKKNSSIKSALSSSETGMSLSRARIMKKDTPLKAKQMGNKYQTKTWINPMMLNQLLMSNKSAINNLLFKIAIHSAQTFQINLMNLKLKTSSTP